ncbi:MAG TPA: TetR/AcrR family transcriptional regulator [Terriglobia bacterium]|nr:TetR/AcrR family transcriptional regulator [Terriglobia bacterium]
MNPSVYRWRSNGTVGLQKFSEDKVLNTLTGLFRDHGYDGISLSLIMKATGLAKASLYHRFRSGKEEMALTVMDRVAGQFASYLLAPLNERGDPAERLRETGERLRKFYSAGKKACLLDTLTVNRESPAVQARAKAALEFWIDSFARFAEDSCGLPRALAMERAQDAVSALEGGLVISRVSGNRSPFLRAIESLPERLMLGGVVSK